MTQEDKKLLLADLWTVEDAKPGDVLSGKINGDNYILIFKQVTDGWVETYGHYYDVVDRFCAPSQLFCRDYQGTFAPAAKEQRDLLFQKMKETGYEWDVEKKELKNIEHEPAWNEEDENVRKWLLNLVQSLPDKGLIFSSYDDIEKAKVLAWLEKQDPKKHEEELEKAYKTADEVQYKRGYEDAVKDMEKQGKQKPAWSEEDEDVINHLLAICDGAKRYRQQFAGCLQEDITKYQTWLKSLKERYAWKPSDEQMVTLEYYMHTLVCNSYKETLFSLYQDLKKLREK